MENKPSRIICKSCGYEPNIITDVCIKCGGDVVKICGNCGQENAVDSVKCVKCGSLLALTPHKKIDLTGEEKEKVEDLKSNENDSADKIKPKTGIEFESLIESISKKDESYRKKIEKPHNPDLKKVEEEREKINNFIKEKKVDESENKNKIPVEEKKDRRKIKLVFTAVLLIVGFFSVYYLFFFRKSYSRYDLIITARKYLSALRDGEYDRAYEYLSHNSKAIVSFSDYVKTLENYYSKIGKWDFKNIEIYYFNKDQGIIKYRLIENGKEKDDYLNFINEYGKWKRPFVYNLFEEIDDAFSKKDFPKALFLSQRLYLIDPVDPRSSGYLCWSEYLMHLYDKSVESCKRVFEMSEIYPVKYYGSNELFWYTFNYADSLRFIGKIEQSIDIYSSLLRNPQVSESDKCSVYLARSDSYSVLKMYSKTFDDLKSAVNACDENSIEKKEAIRRIKILNGGACEDAVMFARKFRYSNMAFEDFIKKTMDEKGARNYSYEFKCSHLEGSMYDVIVYVLKGKKQLASYKISVDLWERNAFLKEEM